MKWTAIVLAACLAACAEGNATTARSGKVRVVATTGMVADLAKQVGGDLVEVEALMGPGIDPHLFKADLSDLARLKEADLILYNGLGLEGKMGDTFVMMARQGRQVVAITEDLPRDRLLEPEELEGTYGTVKAMTPEELEGHYDPHIWFDVALWAATLPTVAAALGRVDPANEEAYTQRANAFAAELRALDDEARKALATVPKQRRVLLTSHDAFRYFGRAYDLEVHGLQGISTVQDAGVKDIQDMAAMISERGIKAVFVETSVNPRAIEAVQQAVRSKGGAVEIGGELFSDAMGDHPPVDTYIGMVRSNVETVVNALK